MTGEYKKFSVKPDDKGNILISVFCHRTTFFVKRNEVENWIRVLMESEGVSKYVLEISDSSWSEATIRSDRLFENHFGEL